MEKENMKETVFCNRWPFWTCQMQDERQTHKLGL